jgi:23S rRNA pseudouridine1911/1915/1917 synthase
MAERDAGDALDQGRQTCQAREAFQYYPSIQTYQIHPACQTHQVSQTDPACQAHQAGPNDPVYRGVRVAYVDNHVLVVIKPPNMPTQADASGDADLLSTMKAYIKEAYSKPGAVYLGLVHRLERPVGGLVVLARTSKAAARLSAQVAARTLRRGYVAVAQGVAPDVAELTAWLRKDERTNTVSVVPPGAPRAKEARLSLACLARTDGLSLLRVSLHTGRSHQIRVQCADAGYPLWGDARYGGGQPGQQIALWGTFLRFEHPTLHTPTRFDAPPPADAAPWAAFDAGRILGAFHADAHDE